MRISKDGLSLIRTLEGSASRPYKDSAGLLTIGVGHLLTRSETMSGKIVLADRSILSYKSSGLDSSAIDALLANDLKSVEQALILNVKYPHGGLRQCQWHALCSFCFNIGVGAFAESTLLKQLNAGNLADVPSQMRRWVHAGGRVVRGLKNRRETEVAMWEGRWHAEG